MLSKGRVYLYAHTCTRVHSLKSKEQQIQIQLCSGFLSSPQGEGVSPSQKGRKRRKRKKKRGTDDSLKKIHRG